MRQVQFFSARRFLGLIIKVMFNHDFDPYAELLRLQSDILQLNQDYLQLQRQLHQTVVQQHNLVAAINNQAEALVNVQKTISLLCADRAR